MKTFQLIMVAGILLLIPSLISCGTDCPKQDIDKSLVGSIAYKYHMLDCEKFLNGELNPKIRWKVNGELQILKISKTTAGLSLNLYDNNNDFSLNLSQFDLEAGGEPFAVTFNQRAKCLLSLEDRSREEELSFSGITEISVHGRIGVESTRCSPWEPAFDCDLILEFDVEDNTYKIVIKRIS